MAATFKPLKTIGETIIAYRQAFPSSSCEEITEFVKKNFKGCNTNPASVACTLGKAAKKLKDNRLTPGRVSKTEELPSFDNVANVHVDEPEESDEDAAKRIFVRYQAMERMCPRVIDGKIPSLIISGPPGVGKSHTTLEAILKSGRHRHDGLTNVGGGGPMKVRLRNDGTAIYPSKNDDDDYEPSSEELHLHPGWYDQIQGACTAVGLYHALWNMRNGGVLFLDDCDAVFRDEDALNILKVATDSTRERLVSWRKNSSWLDEYEIDKTFDFKGQIIFLTNIDFEAVIARNHTSSEHFKALIDRSAYLCLTLRSSRDFMIVLDWKAGGKDGFLTRAPYNLAKKEIDELFEFIRVNQRRFYNLSLRLVGQIAQQMKADPTSWRTDVEATKMRTI